DEPSSGKDPSGRPLRPKVVRKLAVKRVYDQGSATGDNSNSQYAALGLRACHDAGIVLPEETIQRAAKWWRDTARGAQELRKAAGAAPKGWSYDSKTFNSPPDATRGTTAGGRGALA